MTNKISLVLAKLSDQELLKSVKSLVSQEREILIQVLHHLREVERRKLYCDLKYKSLFEYATRELGYADDAAYRRINAMKLLKEVPQIERKIESGALTLSTLCVATTAIRAEAKQTGVARKMEEKLSLLSHLENKSRRESEAIVARVVNIPKAALRPERSRVVDDQVELRFLVPARVEAKIKRIKGLLAHACPQLSTAELFEKLCDDFLEKREKSLAARKARSEASLQGSDLSGRKKPASEKSRAEGAAIMATCVPAADAARQTPAVSAPPKDPPGPQRRAFRRTRFIPASVKKGVWQKAQSRCQNCGSQNALQIDHCEPWGMGGDHAPENLRLLCRACNQRAAIKIYGSAKIQRYTDRPPGF